MDTNDQTSRLIGPEDVKPGDYVTVSSQVFELLPPLCDATWKRDVHTLRVDCIPDESGSPMKVVSVCLPYVLVKTPTRTHCTLDLRRHRVARRARAYGRQAFKWMRRKNTNSTS